MTHHEIAIEKFGTAHSLSYRERAIAPPGPGEVAIDVKYSGVNFADVQMRLGFYPDAPKKPFVPGYEVSGVVTELGAGVTGWKKGDAVVAGTYFGGYASRVTIPATQVFPLPKNATLETGAALPVNYFTAQLALHDMARVRQGDRVLIECATGGVGTLATQMARAAGAEVIGLTTSPHKKGFIENLGAKAYTLDEFYADRSIDKLDLIINSSGGVHINRQRARLGLTGRMVCLGMSSGVKDGRRNFARIAVAALRTPRISVLKLFDANTGIYALNALHVLRDPVWVERMTRSLVAVDKLDLKPHVGKVFAAKDAGAAHAFLETKQATGKVLLAW
ncbi:MAG TPA: alcohol dehydrogenase catalytic domain-containing protein [Kofleriaceae bacterium]|nr:alcohol dehydrogenase catalytic domain-containing protein [Kofleriaceae bacterium]